MKQKVQKYIDWYFLPLYMLLLIKDELMNLCFKYYQNILHFSLQNQTLLNKITTFL